jgi:hypothetical protein
MPVRTELGLTGTSCLKSAEEHLAVRADGGDRPAFADAAVHDQVVSCHKTRRIAGQE